MNRKKASICERLMSFGKAAASKVQRRPLNRNATHLVPNRHLEKCKIYAIIKL